MWEWLIALPLGIGLIWLLINILWWVFVIFLIIYLFRWLRKQFHKGGMFHHEPIDILRERYAKGEITKEEFERIKKDL